MNTSNIEKSIDGVTYISKSLFSHIFDFDSSTELWLTENVKRGCPNIWSDRNYRMITNRFFNWWMKHMPYIYLAMLENDTALRVIYDTISTYTKHDNDGTFDNFVYDNKHEVLKSRLCVGTEFYVDFTKFNDGLYKKLLGGLQDSMKVLMNASDTVDNLINSLTPSKSYQISYVVCNFMYMLVAVMHDDEFCNFVEQTSNYYKSVCDSHSAVYNEVDDNPDEFM